MLNVAKSRYSSGKNSIFLFSFALCYLLFGICNAQWVQMALTNVSVYELATNGANIFAGTGDANSGYGVYLSTNNGLNWIQKNGGMGNITILSLLINSGYILAGSYYTSWKRSLSEIIGIKNISSETPKQFSLSQNYPNPFNPTTRIQFALSKSSFATLVVYDALGREVETLVSEQLNAGTYEADWNASNVPSGVYFYQLTSGEFSQTNKIILAK